MKLELLLSAVGMRRESVGAFSMRVAMPNLRPADRASVWADEGPRNVDRRHLRGERRQMTSIDECFPKSRTTASGKRHVLKRDSRKLVG
jgi:hypothetical protein